MAVESNTYNDYSIAATEEQPLISNFSHWNKPQVGRKLWDVNPVESDLADFMKMGLMKKTGGPETIHHEANSRFDVPRINSSSTVGDVYGVAAGPDDPAEFVGMAYIQLAESSHSPSSGPYALTKSYPRVGQHVMFSNNAEWRIQGKRTSVAGEHRLYITKVQASMPALSATIPLASGVYGGNIFILPTVSFGEQSMGMAEGLVPTAKTFTSYLQEFGDYYKVTNFQEQNETYPLEWEGKILNFTYPKGVNDTEIRLSKAIDNGLFLTNKDDGGLTEIDQETGEAVPVSTTQGYVQNINLNAQKLFYDTTPTLAILDNIERYRRKMQIGGDAMWFVGAEFRTKMETMTTQLGVNGGMVYDRAVVDLNVKQFEKGGVKHSLKSLKILDDPKFGGAPGFKHPHTAIIAPMQKEKDAKKGILLDPFTVLYQDQTGDGAKGWYKMWMTGAMAPRATSRRRNKEYNFAMRLGMQTVAASKHIYINPVTLSA